MITTPPPLPLPKMWWGCVGVGHLVLVLTRVSNGAFYLVARTVARNWSSLASGVRAFDLHYMGDEHMMRCVFVSVCGLFIDLILSHGARSSREQLVCQDARLDRNFRMFCSFPFFTSNRSTWGRSRFIRGYHDVIVACSVEHAGVLRIDNTIDSSRSHPTAKKLTRVMKSWNHSTMGQL